MRLAERLARGTDRLYDRMRSPLAADAAQAAPTGTLDDLRGHKYCVVVTYKRSGEPVPSPLWFGTGNGRIYFQTGSGAAKVKRIKRNPEVRVAAATSRGRPRSAPFVGTARIVPPDEERQAERALQANYGIGRRFYSLLSDRVANVYVEVTPAAPG